eukprot:PhM_4_TR7891/c0_g1_i1/m.6845
MFLARRALLLCAVSRPPSRHPSPSKITTTAPTDSSSATTVSIAWCKLCDNDFATVGELKQHADAAHGRERAQMALSEQWCAELGSGGFSPTNSALLARYEEIGRHVYQRVGAMVDSETSFNGAITAYRQIKNIILDCVPTARVFMFGSLVTLGVMSHNTDLDIAVELEGGVGQAHAAVFQNIMHRLRTFGVPKNQIQYKLRARIPILQRRVAGGCSHPLELPDEGKLKYSLSAVDAAIPSAPTTTTSHPSGANAKKLTSIVMKSLKESNIGVRKFTASKATEVLVELEKPSDASVLLQKAIRTPWGPLRASFAEGTVPSLLHRVNFDIILETYGVRNSALLERYIQQSPYLVPLCMYIKRWAKATGVSNSRGGFLTPYAVVVLVVYHFMRRGHIRFVDPATVQVKNLTGEPVYRPVPPPTAVSPPQSRALGHLLVDFFHFYLREFDYDNHVVSLSSPGVVTKASLGWDVEPTPKCLGRGQCLHYYFAIQEPCEENLSLGRRLELIKVKYIRLQMLRALTALVGNTATPLASTHLGTITDARYFLGNHAAEPPVDVIGSMVQTMPRLDVIRVVGFAAFSLWAGEDTHEARLTPTEVSALVCGLIDEHITPERSIPRSFIVHRMIHVLGKERFDDHVLHAGGIVPMLRKFNDKVKQDNNDRIGLAASNNNSAKRKEDAPPPPPSPKPSART